MSASQFRIIATIVDIQFMSSLPWWNIQPELGLQELTVTDLSDFLPTDENENSQSREQRRNYSENLQVNLGF